MLQGKDGLDHTSKSGGTLAVSHVGLHRPDVDAVCAEDISDGCDFNRVTDRGARSMALHVRGRLVPDCNKHTT